MTRKWLLIAALAAVAADWPQFRGPNGAGVSEEKELPLEWSGTKGIAWKVSCPGPAAPARSCSATRCT
jgi:hypothetical protein